MKTRLLNLWLVLRYSMWFVPSLMAGLAMGLAFATVALDTAVQAQAIRGLEWIYTGSPEGARAMLAAIAGSTITVAGIVVSMTMVVLTLTTSQFGPRLLRNFMRDHLIQLWRVYQPGGAACSVSTILMVSAHAAIARAPVPPSSGACPVQTAAGSGSGGGARVKSGFVFSYVGL